MSDERYTARQADGRSVALCRPDDDELLAALGHTGALDPDDEIPFSILTSVRFHHPVWWRSTTVCQETGHGFCDCGRVSLLEVIELLRGNPQGQQEALDAHITVAHEAWDHFWSGEQLNSPGKAEVNRVCPDCIISAADHLPGVCSEAEELSAELGTALAAYHTRVDLGPSRYPTDPQALPPQG